MAKLVIDVSYAQGRIDWEKVKPHIDGAILQCGYGSDMSSQDDKWYLRNVTECERLDIPYGIYLYSYANSDAKIQSEINHTLRLAKNRNPEIGVFIDLEEADKGVWAAKMAQEFCSRINAAGYVAGIYTGAYYCRQFLSGVNKKVKALWWIAAYGKNDGTAQSWAEPNVGFDIDAWQYTSVKTFPGINGGVDTSQWYTDWETKGQPRSNPVNDMGFSYRSHVQSYGWLPAVRDGQISGTVGEAKRMEAIKITPPAGVELVVDVHLQGIGWKTHKGIKKGKSSGTESSVNDPIMGTVGLSKRLEAIRIKCVKNTTGKQLRYQAHCQKHGWMDAVKEGEIAGTTGQSKRLEAIKIWME